MRRIIIECPNRYIAPVTFAFIGDGPGIANSRAGLKPIAEALRGIERRRKFCGKSFGMDLLENLRN